MLEFYHCFPIIRISFCTADKSHDKVFAYIARNTTNETMECHAFLCAKAKIVSDIYGYKKFY